MLPGLWSGLLPAMEFDVILGNRRHLSIEDRKSNSPVKSSGELLNDILVWLGFVEELSYLCLEIVFRECTTGSMLRSLLTELSLPHVVVGINYGSAATREATYPLNTILT